MSQEHTQITLVAAISSQRIHDISKIATTDELKLFALESALLQNMEMVVWAIASGNAFPLGDPWLATAIARGYLAKMAERCDFARLQPEFKKLYVKACLTSDNGPGLAHVLSLLGEEVKNISIDFPNYGSMNLLVCCAAANKPNLVRYLLTKPEWDWRGSRHHALHLAQERENWEIAAEIQSHIDAYPPFSILLPEREPLVFSTRQRLRPRRDGKAVTQPISRQTREKRAQACKIRQTLT